MSRAEWESRKGVRVGVAIALVCVAVAAIGSLGASIGFGKSASAAQYQYTTDVYCPSGNLQAAIDNTYPYGTVRIHGVCHGQFIVDNGGIQLVGVGTGSGLNGDAGGTVLTVPFGFIPVSISNLTITNGSTAAEGGGIFSESYDQLSLKGSTISNNKAATGGGIYALESGWTISNSTISGNKATAGSGGGIDAENSGVTITNSTLSANTSSADGAGIEANESYLTFNAVKLTGNTAAGDGGGMSAQYTFLSITGSTFSSNHAAFGGGLYSYGSFFDQNTPITNSTFSANIASNSGGGIVNVGFGSDTTMTITNSTISNNTATSGNGGGIVNDGNDNVNAILSLTGSTLSANTAKNGMGGAIYNYNAFEGAAAAVSLYSTRVGPPANTVNGGNQARYGGGIANDASNGSASTVLGTGTAIATVVKNKATIHGGGIYNLHGGTSNGGAVNLNTPDNTYNAP